MYRAQSLAADFYWHWILLNDQNMIFFLAVRRDRPNKAKEYSVGVQHIGEHFLIFTLIPNFKKANGS
ncbi:hypothetical protein AB0758_48970 [Tolypothrix bouteillei VB521301_2]|uniref:hypothetical protein n=1 Tax=Tolypothrix bouteillei TaxID=1246981 RepID=UPI0038B52600